jgi:hypothetical protein
MRHLTMTVNNVTLELTEVEILFTPTEPPQFSPVLYKPMSYLTGNPAAVRGFTFYASVYVPFTSSFITFGIVPVNSTNFITVQITMSEPTNGAVKLLYLKFTGISQPVGFKLSSIDITITDKVIPSASDGNVFWPVEGQGRTAVDYEDADEPA